MTAQTASRRERPTPRASREVSDRLRQAADLLAEQGANHWEGQHTIVMETQGPLAGRRVVRGREAECRRRPGPAAGGAR